MTAPVSAGSVSTRTAPSSAAGSFSGRRTRSKNRDSGRKVAVTENAEESGHRPLLDAVPLGPLVRQETHHGLADGEPLLHRRLLSRTEVIGNLTSTRSAAQRSRTQPCAGSSRARQRRSPGPASTFRW